MFWIIGFGVRKIMKKEDFVKRKVAVFQDYITA
jgi:hypothetical protein